MLLASPRPPAPQPIVRASPFDVLPGGRQGRGMHIDSFWMQAGVGYPYAADFWSNWSKLNSTGSNGASWTNGAWLSMLKPQIDMAKTEGANVIEIPGTIMARYPKAGYTKLSDAAYFAAWRQVLAYCRSKGLYVIPRFNPDSSQFGQDSGYGFTPAVSWFITEYTALVNVFSEFVDVIAFVDLAIECCPWADANTTSAISVYQAVKAAEPRLLFTWSAAWTGSPGNPPVWGANGSKWPDATFSDLTAIDMYYDSPASDVDGLIQAFASGGNERPIFLTEFGQQRAAGTSARQSRFNAVNAVVQYAGAGGARCAGATLWMAIPQDTVDGSNDWGYCDTSFTPRTDVQSIWHSFPN